jgi:hypothetical protein
MQPTAFGWMISKGKEFNMRISSAIIGSMIAGAKPAFSQNSNLKIGVGSMRIL